MPQLKDTGKLDDESRPIGALYSKDPISHAKNTRRPKIKGWIKIYQANGKQKTAEVVVLVSDKTDFKLTKIKKTRKKLHNGKGSNSTKELTILNI